MWLFGDPSSLLRRGLTSSLSREATMLGSNLSGEKENRTTNDLFTKLWIVFFSVPVFFYYGQKTFLIPPRSASCGWQNFNFAERSQAFMAFCIHHISRSFATGMCRKLCRSWKFCWCASPPPLVSIKLIVHLLYFTCERNILKNNQENVLRKLTWEFRSNLVACFIFIQLLEALEKFPHWSLWSLLKLGKQEVVMLASKHGGR